MKRYVNGIEADLEIGIAEVTPLGDRLIVRSEDGAHSAVAVRAGDSVLISYKGVQYRIDKHGPRTGSSRSAESGEMFAPMPGLVADVLVREGDAVRDGQKLLVLEAMKTQQPFLAPFAAVVECLPAQKGAQVVEGELLIVLRTVAAATPAK